MKFLNLGCGNRYHKSWVNIDFRAAGDDVIEHNLLKGIPFPANEFDFVYHSHVLEHFSKAEAPLFLKECYRVLKPGGFIRVAVPDLEQITKHYLKSLEKALAGDSSAAENYEWMMLELYDQAVRTSSGGEMAAYLSRPEINNEQFVYARLGGEAKNIREPQNTPRLPACTAQAPQPFLSKLKKVLKKEAYKNKLKRLLFPGELKFIELGKFKLGGEVHQWMYDRYSLGKLLTSTGFIEPEVKTAFESKIPDWNIFELDSKEGIVFKPDSLFIEARKP